MKNNIKSIIEASIRDNKSYIKSYTENGNIYQYFVADLANTDQGHAWYLTDDEVTAWDNSEAEAERLSHEIHDLIELYDIGIDEYLGEVVEPAYAR